MAMAWCSPLGGKSKTQERHGSTSRQLGPVMVNSNKISNELGLCLVFYLFVCILSRDQIKNGSSNRSVCSNPRTQDILFAFDLDLDKRTLINASSGLKCFSFLTEQLWCPLQSGIRSLLSADVICEMYEPPETFKLHWRHSLMTRHVCTMYVDWVCKNKYQ